MDVSAEQTSHRLLEVVPLVMRAIRAEMRSHRTPDLSVAQFRTLGFVDRNPGVSLSDVAEHMGLALPSISKLVDGLTNRGLASRRESREDRRRRELRLTRAGSGLLAAARSAAQKQLAQRLAGLSAGERAVVAQAMALLRDAFGAAATTGGWR